MCPLQACAPTGSSSQSRYTLACESANSELRYFLCPRHNLSNAEDVLTSFTNEIHGARKNDGHNTKIPSVSRMTGSPHYGSGRPSLWISSPSTASSTSASMHRSCVDQRWLTCAWFCSSSWRKLCLLLWLLLWLLLLAATGLRTYQIPCSSFRADASFLDGA